MLHFIHLFNISATVAPAVDCKGAPAGDRRIIPITGGKFIGERLSGRLMPGGTDVQRIRPDGVAELSINVMLETDNGESILLKGRAIRYATPDIAAQLARGESPDPASYYFRESLTFDTGANRLAWLNRLIAIGKGRRHAESVELDVYEIL
jgi:hypothetical protein